MAAAAPFVATPEIVNQWCLTAAENTRGGLEPLSEHAPHYHLHSGVVMKGTGNSEKYIIAKVSTGMKPFQLYQVPSDNKELMDGKAGALPPIYYAIVAVEKSGDERPVDTLIDAAPYGSYARANCMHKVYHVDSKSWHEYAPADMASDNGRLALSLRLNDWKPPSESDINCAAAWHGKIDYFQKLRPSDKKQLGDAGGCDGAKLVFDTNSKRYIVAKLPSYKGTDADREPVFFAAANGKTEVANWFMSADSAEGGKTTQAAKVILSVTDDGHGGFVLIDSSDASKAPKPVTPSQVASTNGHADTAHALEGGRGACQTCSMSDCVIS